MRVRFAPSPTGSLHVGGARTALYNYLIARKNKGQFILRIEDTDSERNLPEATLEMLHDLAWLGLTWDEGPLCDGSTQGDKGPYFQSQRTSIYQAFAHQLIDQGLAYYCFMQDEELSLLKEAQIASGEVHHVQSPYRDLPLAEAKELLKSKTATVRVKVPEGKKYVFHDAVRGSVELPASMVSDFVIMRSGGSPVYNFCCVVDDYQMGITDVLRGEEHLPNTLKQLIIYDILNWAPPIFAHLSVIVGEDRKKLSKREASVSVGEFREQGYLPEALVNFVALLGWSHPEGEELLTLDQMAANFDLSRVHASPAFFDRQKLKWVNAQYLRAKSASQISELLKIRNQADLSILPEAIFSEFWSLYRSDCETLVDVEQRFNALYHTLLPEVLPEALQTDATKVIWQAWFEALNRLEGHWLSLDQVKLMIAECQSISGEKGKPLFSALRWAVLAKLEGADLKLVATLLPREALIQRVSHYLR